MKTKLLSALMLSASLSFLTSATAREGYVAHEWGTFTSVQGSDGELIHWNPFTAWELPSFVYTRNKPLRGEDFQPHALSFQMLDAKGTQQWLQRMETPVIYFYAEQGLTADVRVRFPSGRITEWYPSASSFGPVYEVAPVTERSEESFAEWRGVRILPPAQPGKAAGNSGPKLITDASGSHYYAARETDANLVQATARLGLAPANPPETEKYIFYRGAGNFTAPLHVTMAARRLMLKNTGAHKLAALAIFELRGQQAAVTPVSALAPGETKTVQLAERAAMGSRDAAVADAGRQLRAALEKAGLYPAEAAAMVQTWRDSWFGEEGLRVLYLLPRAWTDEVLPLSLHPSPRELVRVMVGRAEVIPPEVELKLAQVYADYAQEKSPEVAAQLRPLISGRFLEPALSRLAVMQTAEARRRLPSDSQQPALSDSLRSESERINQQVAEMKAVLRAERPASTVSATPGVATR